MPHWGNRHGGGGRINRPHSSSVAIRLSSNVKSSTANLVARRRTGGAPIAAVKKASIERGSRQGDRSRKALHRLDRAPESGFEGPDGDYIKGLRAVVAAYPQRWKLRLTLRYTS